ncbi:NAD(P)H-flavin reductase/hemoglobin-like flavoprotein [Kitasatospora sp. GAS204A]|uniref:globin domain-containing protein n=1 Tax=unclassified Kitasatospora TaxID=2633591 RepID=UPI0024741726|nr:globin domain-containing protein [Kitasatospora sp. GAS204B]MDH6119587.1 NAD(P)H-flavin reductase/hemoglobin-like flavoprotein [Kitasatospora sp. GAS204B]
MSTRQVKVKSLSALLVRSGHGSPAATAVPGMSAGEAPPDPPAGRPVLPVVVPPMPSEPPAIPAPVAETRPPAEPSPLPDPRAAIEPRPAIEPLFRWAPGLNWAGPGDHWSQAWAVETLGTAAPPPALAPAVAPAAQPPTPRDLELIRATLAVVEPVADRATAHFYALIFLHHPEIRSLFPAGMDVQRDRLFRALLQAARSADDPASLTAYLTRLGQGHRKYGTLTGHYAPVGECLVASLARYCGSHWDAETELAWRRVYGVVAQLMIDAAEQAAKTSPPWWQAEVVSHQSLGRDIAQLTVRPDQAYPYRAGQYTTLETPWWPRVWRHFSFATAPRPDGLLTFHVKALQAGWVSSALVRRAAPGDVLRLGPPAGTMVLDHADPGRLLCLGGGTGIAPIAALVEEVAEHGAAGRRLEVFYGARQAAELYQLPALRELERRHPWLAVHPVLSEERTDGALCGLLSDVVVQRGPWDGHRAFLSGPPAMVRRAAAALTRSGVRPEWVHHDLGAE